MKASAALRFFGLPALCAVVLLAAASTPASAQLGTARLGAQNGALGGGPATLALHGMTHPLGGFATIPGVTPGFNNARTGFSPGRSFNGGNRRRQTGGYPYAYSVWVPDYFDYVDQMSQYYAAPYGVPVPPQGPPMSASPQQPVIINQYFNSPAPPTASPAEPQAAAPEGNTTTSAVTPGEPLSTPQTYYLIAYKDHAIYAALAYWLEDRTLHYVTTQNMHNQASLDLIDMSLTKSLNQDRNVPFSISGQ